jgi:hypothetical protein
MQDVGVFYGHLVYLWPFSIFWRHLINFMVIWYIFSRFGILRRKNLATLMQF